MAEGAMGLFIVSIEARGRPVPADQAGFQTTRRQLACATVGV